MKVNKEKNGYRNYTQEEIDILKEISAYRKLGIAISDIKKLIENKDDELLVKICLEKERQNELQNNELKALQDFIRNKDLTKLYEKVDYKTIGEAMQEMLPGVYGAYFKNHFQPYLQITLKTPEQKQAYKNIVSFWDDAKIKIPLFMQLSSWVMYKVAKPTLDQQQQQMEKNLQKLLNPSQEEYAKLLQTTKKAVKYKNSVFYKYSPACTAQKKFAQRLKDCGYNDVFLPNMVILSPPYKEYHDAITNINDRICAELGLYYDSNYNLIIKNNKVTTISVIIK